VFRRGRMSLGRRMSLKEERDRKPVQTDKSGIQANANTRSERISRAAQGEPKGKKKKNENSTFGNSSHYLGKELQRKEGRKSNRTIPRMAAINLSEVCRPPERLSSRRQEANGSRGGLSPPDEVRGKRRTRRILLHRTGIRPLGDQGIVWPKEITTNARSTTTSGCKLGAGVWDM